MAPVHVDFDECGLAVFGLGVELHFALTVPSVAGKSAGQEQTGKLAVAQGNDLCAELVLVANLADVFALDGEIRPGFRGIEEGLVAFLLRP